MICVRLIYRQDWIMVEVDEKTMWRFSMNLEREMKGKVHM